MTPLSEPAGQVDATDAYAVPFRARIRTGEQGPGAIRIAGWLTPYELETLAQEARGMGRGARLELTLGANASEGRLEWVRRRFAGLGNRGIEVSVWRDGDRRHTHASGPAARARGQRGG